MTSKLIGQSPFRNALSASLNRGSGIVIRHRHALDFATVQARRAQRDSLEARLRSSFNIELPRGPYGKVARDLSLLGTGPATWLALRDHGAQRLALSLIESVADTAAVTEQSDAYGALRLSGPKVRDVLAKLVPVDVHEKVFKVGDVVVTAAAQIGATLWRIEDDIDRLAVFEIAVYRSLAVSFWHALVESAGEFGITTWPSENV